MNLARIGVVLLFSVSLLGCGRNDMDDLRKFMDDTGKNMRGKVEPLPQIQPYAPFTYNAFDLPDPFKPRKLKPAGSGGGLKPDLDRPKEPLEGYSLETLKMVGVIGVDGKLNAIIQTPDKGVYRVHVGNYMGQDFGLISEITDSEVKLKEIVQDGSGDWSERSSTLTLQE